MATKRGKDRKLMSDEKLNGILSTELDASSELYDSELAEQQANAMERYLGEPYGTEVKGRSHYVSRDALDTVEWIMPMMMDIYTSTDTPIVIKPQNESDVPGARQESEYCSYILNRRNDGFLVVHDFIKDALIQKFGVVKHWYDKSETSQEEDYENLNNEELEMLLSDPDVEVIEHTVYVNGEETDTIPDANIEGVEFEVTHDVKVSRVTKEGQIRVVNVPSEEFRISKAATRKSDATYMAHITDKTVSDLIQMGFDRDLIEGLASDSSAESLESRTSPQYLARHAHDSTYPQELESQRNDPAMRQLKLEEHYVYVDYNGDGVAELRQIFRIGKEILWNEAIHDFPFSFWSPIRIPHKLVGLSVVDLVEDLQRLKTHLTRAMVDNVNNVTNGGFTVLEGMVDLDDLMTTGPLKIVRQRVPNAVQRLDNPSLPAEAFQMLGYIDSVRDSRTGVNENTKGMDSKALGSNTASGAVTQVLDAAQKRVQLIARIFAETGLKDLYRAIHELVLRYAKEKDMFQLNESFVAVDPAAWKSRKDFMVTVGTGFANRDQKMLHLQMLSQDIGQLAAAGSPIVQQKNLYNLAREKINAVGFKNVSDFITDPDKLQPQGPSEAEQLAMEQARVDMQVKQQEAAIKESEAQIKAADAAIKQQQANIAAAKADAEIQAIKDKTTLDALKIQIERQKLSLMEEELKLEKEQKRGVQLGR